MRAAAASAHSGGASFNPYESPAHSLLGGRGGAGRPSAELRGARFLQAAQQASEAWGGGDTAEDRAERKEAATASRGRRRGRGGASAAQAPFPSSSFSSFSSPLPFPDAPPPPIRRAAPVMSLSGAAITVVKQLQADDDAPTHPHQHDSLPSSAASPSPSPLPSSFPSSSSLDSFATSSSPASPSTVPYSFLPSPISWPSAAEDSSLLEETGGEEQPPLLQLLSRWNDACAAISPSPPPKLTLQQLSVLRDAVRRRDPQLPALLLPSSQPSPSLWSSLSSFTAAVLDCECECRSLQSSEVSVLRAIFPSSELSVSPTLPLSLTVTVRLESIDCEVELAFLFPSLYPLRSAVTARSFIPPPFSDLFPLSASSPSPLQLALEEKAQALVGEEGGAVYGLIEEARQWMEAQLERLRQSKERRPEEEADGSNPLDARALLVAVQEGLDEATQLSPPHEVRLFGRGHVEQLMASAIHQVVQAGGVSRAKAKALLKEKSWVVPELVKVAAFTSSAVPAADEESVEELFADEFDASASLQCLSCMEECQWREGAMMRCRHFLCFPCYDRYLLAHLGDGSAFIRDPGHKCEEGHISEELLFALLSPYDYARYRRYLQDSFITLQRWRWCPNPHCAYVAASQDASAFVLCHCRACYCLACGKAGHWPSPCGAASAYFSSAVISDLRRKYNAMVKLEKEKDEGVLTFKLKPCPRCKTKFERDGGCNHIKCVKCAHHFCFVCLGDWATHGVSWFECPYSEREVRFRELTFHEGEAISDGDMDTIRALCGREVDHAMRAQDIQHSMADPAAMAALIDALPGTSPTSLSSLLRALLRAHSILQHVYILLCPYKRQCSPPHISANTQRLLQAMNQLEYFVDALDQACILVDEKLSAAKGTRVAAAKRVRQVRSEYQLGETMKVVVKRMRELASAVQVFLDTDARVAKVADDEAEDGAGEGTAEARTKAGMRKAGEVVRLLIDPVAFFTTLDRKSGQAGKAAPSTEQLPQFDAFS